MRVQRECYMARLSGFDHPIQCPRSRRIQLGTTKRLGRDLAEDTLIPDPAVFAMIEWKEWA